MIKTTFQTVGIICGMAVGILSAGILWEWHVLRGEREHLAAQIDQWRLEDWKRQLLDERKREFEQQLQSNSQ